MRDRSATFARVVAAERVERDRFARLEMTVQLERTTQETRGRKLRDAQAVLEQQARTMRVSWYVNVGELAYDRTGRTNSDSSVTENRWQLPNKAGSAQLWIVLRDSRGGVTHASYEFAIQ